MRHPRLCPQPLGSAPATAHQARPARREPAPALLAGLALLLAWPASAAADPRGEELIRKIDERMTRQHAEYFEYELATEEPGKERRVINFNVTIQGDRNRRIEFTSPPDIAGMRILVQGTQDMYAYLPAYRKVRRLASHNRDQGFMGSAYGFDEIALVTYGTDFSWELLRETPDKYVLRGTRKPGVDFLYAGLELDARKADLNISALRYFNDKGQQVKVEVRSNYECRGRSCAPALMKMVETARPNVRSTMTIKRWLERVDPPESFFTVADLQRER